MTVKTRSKFYYDYQVKTATNEISFDEGSGELTATLRALKFTPSGLAIEVSRAMNEAGVNDYLCTFDREERKFKITSLGTTFEILGATNSSLSSAINFLGFDSVDTGYALEHTSDNSSGKVYRPQFLLQDFISFEDWEVAAYGVRRKTATGGVEDIRFGTESFAEFNITYITDVFQPHKSPIENDPNALDNIREFLRYATNSGPFEFMPDRAAPESYHEVILESTQADRNGQGYKLRELYSKNLIDYFETGKIKLRKI